VVLIIGALVVAVLVLNLVSAFVPGMDGSLAAWPIVIAILVGGTAIVLVGALRR
jgi:hypothetical protein